MSDTMLPKTDDAAAGRPPGFLRRNFQQPTFLGYVAIGRIFIGIHFLIVGAPKLVGMTGESLAAQLSRTAARDPISFHRDFIVGFVVPHADAFSSIVAYGEVAIGLSLVAGCLVRVSSAFGAFHNLNILLAIAIPVGGAQIGINLYFHRVTAGVCHLRCGSLARTRCPPEKDVPAKLALLTPGGGSAG